MPNRETSHNVAENYEREHFEWKSKNLNQFLAATKTSETTINKCEVHKRIQLQDLVQDRKNAQIHE